MRNSASTDRRLREIEGKRGMAPIRLVFADGSTRGIQIARDYTLELFTHVCVKLCEYPPPAPEGVPIDLPPLEPTTSSDQLIDLLAAAKSIEVENDRFLETIHFLCQTLGERRAALGGEKH
jgi:hypothetical protein